MEIIHGEGVAVIVVHLESLNVPVLWGFAPVTPVTGDAAVRGIVVTLNSPFNCDRGHVVAAGRVVEKED
jgi:hypothetical protein